MSQSTEAPPITTADEALDLLNQDAIEEPVDDKAPVKKIKEPVEDESDDEDDADADSSEDNEDDELDLVDEDEDKEKIDLKDDVEVDTPPRVKEITKEFPDFFKKFPFVKKMMFRDKQMQELFGSYDDAVASHDRAETLERFETELLDGNPTSIFSDVKENDPKAYDKLVKNLLPSLAKVDRQAYLTVASDVVSRMVGQMVAEGKRLDNKDLQEAAVIINQFVFGTSEYRPPSQIEAKPQDEELTREREEFQREKLNDAVGTMETRVGNILRNTISDNIDKAEQMTPFVKKNAVRMAFEEVDRMMDEDTTFKSHMNKLWKNAIKEKFTRSSMEKIESAHKGKARQLIPLALKKARNEALKGLPTRKVSDEDNDAAPRKRGTAPTGRPAPIKRGKSEMKQGETVLDYFNRDD